MIETAVKTAFEIIQNLTAFLKLMRDKIKTLTSQKVTRVYGTYHG